MTILTETLSYPRIGKNPEVNKGLEALSSRKSNTDALLLTVLALKNIVKYAALVPEKANAT